MCRLRLPPGPRCGGVACRLVPLCANGCRHGPDGAVLCRGGARPPPRSPQQTPDRPAGYGQCQIVSDGAGECRVVPSDAAWWWILPAGDDQVRLVRGIRMPDPMARSGTRRLEMARPVTTRPETARRPPRHSSAPSGTIRHCAALHGMDRTGADSSKSRRRRRQPEKRPTQTVIAPLRVAI
jgi:hypothetical protein